MEVVPVPVREDNYAYLLIDSATRETTLVDVWDVDTVKRAVDERGLEVVAALTTHHHFDHAHGNDKFAATYPGVPIIGGSEKVQAVSKIVKDNDELQIGGSIQVKCLATPCHTRDSICYYATCASSGSRGVFTGDTLFVGGCGKFKEGTGAEMHAALARLAALPDDTVVYNGHEYTAANVRFARTIDPGNKELDRLGVIAQEHAVTAGRTTVGQEREWNVFMRLGTPAVREALQVKPGTPENEVMSLLRETKDNFKA